MPKILLVDDDLELCELLRDYLQGEGFEVEMVHDGGQVLDITTKNTFDVIVLDVMIPNLNGFEVLRKLRDYCKTPVLMLTAKGDTVDRIVGLELGADDYLAKPCNPRELVARLRAILRRIRAEESAPRSDDTLTVDQLKIHLGSRTVQYHGEPVTLTGAEFAVLEWLMRSPGQVISKDVLTEEALGRKLTPYDRSIDVHISNIRKKLAARNANKDLIINIRGAGYMLTTSDLSE
ncbi:MAG: response regulator transcription factor [Cellvibrionaceae bacterium]